MIKKSLIPALILLLSSCAQVVDPSGGEKDTTPPQLVNDKCSPSYGSTHFSGRTLILEFDEFVRMNNPGQNVIISPSLEKTPAYLLKGKTLRIDFNESLAENTTYTISFGNTFSDLTEGNVARGLNFVFSTGDFIDSLEVMGNVSSALEATPEKNVLVLLYPANTDSALLKGKPSYFAMTDPNGNFHIRHIREGKYNVFALKDQAVDFIYSPFTEEIAFADSVLHLRPENFSQRVDMRLFREEKGKIFRKAVSVDPSGKITVLLNIPSAGARLSCLNCPDEVKFISLPSLRSDTLNAFVQFGADISECNILLEGPSLRDTLSVRFPKKQREDFLKRKIRVFTNLTEKFSRYEKILFRCDDPLAQFDSSKVQFLRDSVSLPFSAVKKGVLFESVFSFEKDENSRYLVRFLPGAFLDIYGRTNDSLQVAFDVLKKSHYGKLRFALNGKENRNYILELRSRGEVLATYSTSTGTLVITNDKLLPGTYRIKIIQDANANGKWDSGDFDARLQPEKVSWYGEDIVIRSNWDIDLKMILN